MAVPNLDAVVSGQPLVAGQPAGSAPVLILGSALGSNHNIWNGTLPALEERFAVVRFDLPGHGVTPVASAGFTMDDLADGIAELATRLRVERFFYAGVSIGGALALVLSRRHPDRVLGAGVVCSAATFGGAGSGFAERATSVRAEGMGFVTPSLPGRWFAPSFIEAHPDVVERVVGYVAGCDAEGYAQCCDALVTHDEVANLSSITTPTVVISGELDPGSTPEAGRLVAEGVPHGHLVVVPETSHMAVVENPDAVAHALLDAFAN